MNPLLVQIYSVASTKYRKFKFRLDRSIASGRFYRFSRRKQHQLYARVKRLQNRVLQLHTQLKLAAASAAFGLILNTTPVQAQTTLGPFVRNYVDNPLPPPLPQFDRPVPLYADLNADGDDDLIVGHQFGLEYFKNIGTTSKPTYLKVNSGDAGFPFEGIVSGSIPGNRRSYAPTLADIDDDGDLDLLIGTDDYKYGYGQGETYYFKNIGSATAPDFQLQSAALTPFKDSYGVPLETLRFAHPTLTDLDLDGDYDLLLGGYYNYSTAGYILQYYENTGTKSNPIYTKNTTHSLLAAVNNQYSSYQCSAQTIDLDDDGDLDVVLSVYSQVIYLRNDNGVFASEADRLDQQGPWDPVTKLGNPFHAVNTEIPGAVDNVFISLVDLDNDSDLDVLAGFSYYYSYSYDDSERSFKFFRNNGNAVFALREGLNSPVDGIDLGNSSNASFVDIDGDQDLDVFTSGSIAYTFCPDGCYNVYEEFSSLYEYDNGELFDITGEPEDIFTTINLPPQAKAKLVDLNEDGLVDLIAPFYNDPAFKVSYFKNVAGALVNQTSTNNPLEFINENGIVSLDFGDLDGDGLKDFVMGRTGQQLRLYKNTGTSAEPIYTRRTDWETGFLANMNFNASPKFLDIDNDGDLDVVVGKYNEVWYYENTGNTTDPFFVEKNGESLDNPFRDIIFNRPAPEFIDLDGDGDLDMLSGDEQGQFNYFENTNPPPVAVTAASLSTTENNTVLLDPAVTINDPDNDLISEVNVSIINYEPDNEVLVFTNQNGISGTFNSATGVLTLRGKNTVAIYTTAIKSITYQYTGSKPASGGRKNPGAKTVNLTRTISFLVRDLDRTTPLPTQVDIAVTFPNVDPVIAGSPAPVTYINTPIVVGSTLTLSDGDDADLEGATISITAGLVNTEDQLLFTNQNGITGNYNPTTGVLMLTGVSSLANYQTAILSIQYNNTSATPNSQSRTISFLVTDGEDLSNLVSVDVGVTVAPNVAPVLAGTLPDVTFSTSSVIVASAIIVSDSDDTDLTGATVTISTGLVPAEDQLVFTNQNGISGSYSSTTGVLTLTGTSSVANYQTAIRSIRYNNTSTTPNTQNRVVSFLITDGTDTSNTLTATVLVVIPNNPPQIATITQSTQIGSIITVNLSSFLSDPDNDLDLTSLQIVAQPTSGATASISGTVLQIDYSNTDFAGTDQLTIEVCDLSGACALGIITVTVEGEIIVYNGFSPNGDLKNAYFRIANIQALQPINRVSIYNRWGSLVFETDNYDNNTRRFEGNNQNGNPLPSGVYFYKIEFPGGAPGLSGYVTLKR